MAKHEIWNTYWGFKENYHNQNLICVQGVTSNFTHITKSTFCHVCRVSRSEEQAENQYVARLDIRGVLFGG